MKSTLSILVFFSLCGTAFCQDVLFLRNGERRIGTVTSVEGSFFRLSVPLDEKNPALIASVTVRRTDVAAIEFFFDPVLEKRIHEATSVQLPEIRELWKKYEPYLGIPKSFAARIGLSYGNLLLQSGDVDRAQESLELFLKLEAGAWAENDRMLAKQGRLRAMVATGKAAEAITEANELARISEDPAVLIEAKYILAVAAGKDLHQLVEDNPRWEEDEHIRPERFRLSNQCIDLFLFPALFYASEKEPAARGLWGAIEIYEFLGDHASAMEVCRDILTIYPDTKYAKSVEEFIARLPAAIRHQDVEKEEDL